MKILNLLGFVLPGPSILWRLGAYAVIFLSAMGIAAAKMHEHDQAKFDAFEAQVKAAGDKQNALTKQIIQAHQQLKEASDAEAKRATAARDAALARLRSVQQASAGSGIVPAAPTGTAGSDRLCLSRDELDRRLGDTLARAAARLGGIASEGQRAVDVATVCRNWAAGLAR